MAYLESNSIDLSHSFDLNGTDNDEMLRLYLRKAGCSDKIEYLSPEERKAFIYDIIKSNKMPGYWVPSTMRASAFPAPPPELLQTPQPQPQMISAPMYAVHNNNQSSTPTPTLSSSSSSHSLKSLPQQSSTYYAAPPTPPSPTTFVTSHKGSKYQISGPMNFRHLDGDMTRDMTRNAFDLNSETNDNILKKYMIERNIKEQDLTGMRKRDIIRNIVHSKFTWKPNKKKEQVSSEPELKYASISSNFERTPPPDEFEEPPIPFEKFSNFNLVSARFNDPSLFPKPDEIFGQPPQDDNKIGTANLAAPPPPSAVQAVHNYSRHYSRSDSYYATLPRQKESNLAVANESLYATVKVQRKEKPLRVDIPMPPAPSLQQEQQFGSRRGLVPPPTPPKPVSKNGAFPAFAMGIPPQQQMPVMKNHQTKPPPPPIRKTTGVGAPPPPPPLPAISNANGGSVPMTAIPPPPPPPTANSGNTLIPPPPPPPPLLNSGGGPVPPPPPMPANAAVPKRLQANNEKAPNLTGDPRDELLNSIRNGVTLRKVNQKASTISGIKPRPKSKPPAVDFLSELKMGITLRRVKNPADNPYAKDADQESEA